MCNNGCHKDRKHKGVHFGRGHRDVQGLGRTKAAEEEWKCHLLREIKVIWLRKLKLLLALLIESDNLYFTIIGDIDNALFSIVHNTKKQGIAIFFVSLSFTI